MDRRPPTKTRAQGRYNNESRKERNESRNVLFLVTLILINCKHNLIHAV